MSITENRDSLQMKEVSMADVVDMCNNCTELCLHRTERLIKNNSRAPLGWEKLYNSRAEERRSEEFTRCREACELVQRSCPASHRIREYELNQVQKELYTRNLDVQHNKEHHLKSTLHSAVFATNYIPRLLNRKSQNDTTVLSSKEHKETCHKVDKRENLLSLQEVSRCEHAVQNFSTVLFTIAHKPSKIMFENTLRQPEESASAVMSNNEPTEVHKKVLRGAQAIDDEIMRRWSTAHRSRLNMEAKDILRSKEEMDSVKAELQHYGVGTVDDKNENKEQNTVTHGTVPEW